MRPYGLDEVAHHTEVRRFMRVHAVDPAGIGRRLFVLPGEVLTPINRRRKSAEVIVAAETSCVIAQRSHQATKDRT